MVAESQTLPGHDPADLALLAAILDPATDRRSLDPLRLARLLKDPAMLEALEAHEAISSYRARQQLTATTAKAVARLDAILDTAGDPVEVRRISGILSRLQQRTPLKPTILRASAGAAPPADPASSRDRRIDSDESPPRAASPRFRPAPPDPYNPASPALTEAIELPDPTAAATPTDIVRAQLQTLRHAAGSDNPIKLIYSSIALPTRMATRLIDAFAKDLRASPAWTHRALPSTIHEPAITGQTATVRVTFHPAEPTDTPPTCIFRLALSSSLTPCYDKGVWIVTSITQDDSGPVPRASSP